jgi:hypothetical protein
MKFLKNFIFGAFVLPIAFVLMITIPAIPSFLAYIKSNLLWLLLYLPCLGLVYAIEENK